MGEAFSEGGSGHKGSEAMTPLLALADGQRGSTRRTPGLSAPSHAVARFSALFGVSGWSPVTPSQRLTKSQPPAIYQSLVDSNDSPAYFLFIYIFIHFCHRGAECFCFRREIISSCVSLGRSVFSIRAAGCAPLPVVHR